MRRGELFNLKWEKVDFTRNVIYVSNTKSGKDRVIPMHQTVRDELIRMSEQADGEFVFVSKRTGLNLTETKKVSMPLVRMLGSRTSDSMIYDTRPEPGWPMPEPTHSRSRRFLDTARFRPAQSMSTRPMKEKSERLKRSLFKLLILKMAARRLERRT
jgi:Phage integrase family